MPKRQFTWNCSCSDFLWLYIERQSPRRPCDILVANVGPEIAKLQNVPIWQNVPKLPKIVQSLKSPKITKNSILRVKPGILETVCARVTIQGPDRPRSLAQPSQLIPARSGPRSLAQLPKGPGKVPSVQGASQRSYKAQESFSVPRDVFRSSPGKLLFQPLETVPRTESTWFLLSEKL